MESESDATSFVVYLLESTSGCTYVGATVNIDKRIRQHNGELVGGAHYTTSKVAAGETWIVLAFVEGFPTWQSALQFEWRWKHLTRKCKRGNPRMRRVEALEKLMALPKSTSNAIPFAEFPRPLKVNWQV